ncbi:sugar ABC transporter substrate-binding protein [Lachnospiraceae bacterium 54-53]
MKKTVKRFGALGLVLMLSGGMLGGCGSPGGENTMKAETTEGIQASSESGGEGEELKAEDGAEIEITYWEGSQSDKAAWDWAIENLKKDHPEITVKPQVYPSNTYRDQLDTRIAGDDWPDVIRYTYQRLGKFKETDTMLDLTPCISEENLNDLVPAFREACTYNGKLVAMPHHTDVIALFYNKQMLEDAGIEVPKSLDEAWSWDEFTEIARRLKKDNDLDYAMGGIWENSSGYRYLPFLYMNGGALMNEDQTEITMNTQQVLEAIQLYESWRKEDLINNVAFTATPASNMMFVANQLAFDFAGSWHCSYMEENMPDGWGVTYMPQKDGKTGSDMGGNGIFAYAGTKYPKAAAIVAEYLTSAEQMKGFCETGNFIPVRQSLLEGDMKFTAFQEEMKLFMEIAGTIDEKMASDETSVPFQNLNVAFNEAMDPMIVDGSRTAEEVAAICQETMTEILQEYE